MRSFLFLVWLAAWMGGGEARAEDACDDLTSPRYPVAGTRGFTIAREAMRTNSNTYNAASFADRELNPRAEGVRFAFLGQGTFGVADVPVTCGSASTAQPMKWEPLDLYSMNGAVSLGWEPAEWIALGGFYSASVTMSTLGTRLITPMSTPIMLYPLTFAPLIGTWQRADGLGTMAVDWIGGAWLDTPVVTSRVGYTGIRGFYGAVDEKHLGLFGSFVLRSQVSRPWSYLKFGLDRFGLGTFGMKKVQKKVGFTSLYLRDLPFAGASAGGAAAIPGLSDGRTGERLQTLHLEQQSIAELVDVSASLAREPVSQLYDLQLGVHSRDFHPRRSEKERDVSDEGGLVRIGFVNAPARYDYGYAASTLFSARLAYSAMEDNRRINLVLLFNDPEQLALFPFARNALGLRVEFLGASE
jgi:hypothetical protein